VFELLSFTGKMDTHVADEKLKELHVEDTTVKANRDALQYEIDPVAEKKLLRKIDLHVVPILWFLFMYVNTLANLACGALMVSEFPG
jgi:phosphoribosylaminoimidazole carboxylase (NCAIR synthetase)